MKKRSLTDLRKLALLAFFFFPRALSAQQLPVLIERLHISELEAEDSLNFNTAIKPWIHSRLSSSIPHQSVRNKYLPKHKLIRKLKSEHLVSVDTGDFQLYIDPLMHGHYGKTDDTSKNYINTRGILVQGNLGSRFSFNSTFQETQAYYPDHIRGFIAERNVAPGQGRVKSFKGYGYDYFYGSGLISYSPTNQFNIIAGHGKNFIGDGYRSLILSDNAFNYPFMRFNFEKNRFSYTSIYAAMMIMKGAEVNISPGYTEPFYRKKPVSVHHVAYRFGKWLTAGLTETTIWKVRSYISGLPDPLFFNPVIFSNTFANGFAGQYNTMASVNLKVNPLKKLFLYGQYVIDDPSQNKNGLQAGFKYHDAFFLKNLFLQAEYNTASSFTYAYYNSFQSFSHLGQELAHPSGSNFDEVVGIVQYRYKDFTIDNRMIYQHRPDSAFQYTSSVLTSQPFTFNPPSSSRGREVIYLESRIMYKINHAYNLYAFAGIQNRQQMDRGKSSTNDQVLFFGIRTLIENIYHDF